MLVEIVVKHALTVVYIPSLLFARISQVVLTWFCLIEPSIDSTKRFCLCGGEGLQGMIKIPVPRRREEDPMVAEARI
jgi:hypothetical protein